MYLDPLFIVISKLVITGLFLHAGYHKAMDVANFRKVLMSYGIALNNALPAAYVIIVLEIAIGISIFVGGEAAMVAASSLLGFYTLLLMYNFLRGRAIDCGCNFGSDSEPIGIWHIARNVILLCVAGVHLMPSSGRVLQWLDYTTAIFASVIFGLLLVIIEHLNVNHHYFNRIRNAS